MAIRKNRLLLKRSNVSGNKPIAGQILLGELALNTADVILYASGTTTNSILPIGWDRLSITGGTLTGNVYGPFFSATTISSPNFIGLPLDVRVTGGTYNNGTATFTNNTGGTFNVSGYYTGYTPTQDIYVIGATKSGTIATFTNNSGGTFTLTGITDTIFTGGTVNGTTIFNNGIISNSISATTYNNLPKDIFITGGTYSNGTTTFRNNTGGTFNISGYSTGGTSSVVASRIRRSVNQSIQNGSSYSDLILDTSSYQSSGTFWVSGSSITIPESGYYQIFVETTFDGTGLLTVMTGNLQVLLNNIIVIGDDEAQVAINSLVSLSVMAQRYFNVGDTIKSQVKHTNNTPVNIIAQGDHSPDIIITKIGGVKGDAGNNNLQVNNQTTDITTSSTSVVNTNLAFIVEPNSIYSIDGYFYGGCNSSGGMRFDLITPSGSTGIHSISSFNVNTISNAAGSSVFNINTQITGFAASNNTQQIKYSATLLTDTLGGIVTPRIGSSNAGQTSIFRTFSNLKITKK